METEEGEDGLVRVGGQGEAPTERPQECGGSGQCGVRRVPAGQREPGRRASSGAGNLWSGFRKWQEESFLLPQSPREEAVPSQEIEGIPHTSVSLSAVLMQQAWVPG